jgi:hypothetical protein
VSEENKKLVREITEVVWNSRGLDRIPEFYALDFVGDYRPLRPSRRTRGRPRHGRRRLDSVS